MRWFPSYFNVEIDNRTFLKLEDVDGGQKHLKIIHLNTESDKLSECLGVDEDRYIFLVKQCRKAVIDTSNMADAMIMMNKHLGHINEFYLCAIMVQDFAQPNRGPAGLMDLLLGSIKGGPTRSPEE